MKGTTPDVYSVFHGSHRKEDKGLILLPITDVLLRYFKDMRAGDYIIFDEETEKREIVRFGKVNLHTTLAELLCKYIYNSKLERIMERWVNNAIALGQSRGSVSRDYCMIIYYKTDERR